MIVLRAARDAEVDDDLRKKGFTPVFRKIVRDVERQRVASLAQGRIFLVKITHSSIGVGRSGSDYVARTLERDADSLCRLAECGVQYVRAEGAQVASAVPEPIIKIRMLVDGRSRI